MSAIVGRPLAIASGGISLELAESPKNNQSLIDPNQSKTILIDQDLPVKLGRSGFVDGFVCHVDAQGVPYNHRVHQLSETRSRFVQAMQTIRSNPYSVDPFLDANIDI